MKLSSSVVGAGVLGLAIGIGAVMLVPIVHGKNTFGILSAHDSPVTVRGGSIRAWTKDSDGWVCIDAACTPNTFRTKISDPTFKNILLVQDHQLNMTKIPQAGAWEVDVISRAKGGSGSGIILCSDIDTNASGSYICGKTAKRESWVYMLVMDKNDSLEQAEIDEDGSATSKINHMNFHRRDGCSKCEYISTITVIPNTPPYTLKCHNSACTVGLSNK